MEPTEAESVDVYRVSKSTYKSQKLNDWSHDQKSTNDCTRCGDPDCKSWSTCAAKDAECFHCEKIGHFAKVCFFANKGRPPEFKKGRKKGGRV